MYFQRTTDTQKGFILVIALIVLAILGALGLASLQVADINTKISANDRDTKSAFFHADSGANIGHLFLSESLKDVNSTFYNSTPETWSATFNATNFPLKLYTSGSMGTYIRAGTLDVRDNAGNAQNMGEGYGGGPGKSASSGGTSTSYIIRSHRIGARNSDAEVDVGWMFNNQ